jgi:hypothetical protein
MFAMSALVTVLVCCKGEAEPSDDRTASSFEAPAFVQELIETDFPADGKIHVQSVGEITISPDTWVCYSPDGFVVDPRKLFAALGQKENVLSGSRFRPALDGQCNLGSDMVLMKGLRSENREGAQYKLTLAVWQGNAAWVGGVERLDHEWHPRFDPTNAIDDDFLDIRPRPRPTEEESLEFAISASSQLDAMDLSELFIETIGIDGAR